jgi:hypothetical protein
VVECLPNKGEALRSNPRAAQKRKLKMKRDLCKFNLKRRNTIVAKYP